MKAKLTQKSKWLPTALLKMKMPAGSDAIADVPTLFDFCRDGQLDLEEYARSVRAVAKVFRTCQTPTTWLRSFAGCLTGSA